MASERMNVHDRSVAIVIWVCVAALAISILYVFAFGLEPSGGGFASWSPCTYYSDEGRTEAQFFRRDNSKKDVLAFALDFNGCDGGMGISGSWRKRFKGDFLYEQTWTPEGLPPIHTKYTLPYSADAEEPYDGATLLIWENETEGEPRRPPDHHFYMYYGRHITLSVDESGEYVVEQQRASKDDIWRWTTQRAPLSRFGGGVSW